MSMAVLFWAGMGATIHMVLLIGTLAALAGFLFFNWNPSRMYMGDTGSQFLGLYLAFVGIMCFWNPLDKLTVEFDRGRQIAGVLIATVTVGVFAATMGCQSQAGQGAPLDATPEAAVEQTTGLADPMPHRIQSPHGDFHARPPQQHIADWPPAQKKPSGDVSASKAQVRSPHGDFEALPPASPKN